MRFTYVVIHVKIGRNVTPPPPHTHIHPAVTHFPTVNHHKSF